MRTKFDIKVGTMAVEINGQLLNTPEVNIQTDVEFTLGEAKGLYDLQKQIVSELPGIFKDLAISLASAFSESEQKIEEIRSKDLERQRQEKVERSSLFQNVNVVKSERVSEME